MAVGGDSNTSSVAKKLNHNASEHDRCKKINNLYSSLRSLVPADHAKRLSIPATVSQLLKYIPELQGQIQKRDKLLSKISKQQNVILQEEKQLQSAAWRSRSSLSAVSTYRLNDGEISIQISTFKSANNTITSFESSGGKVFYILHL